MKPATTEQIARNGDVAVTIRKALEAKGWGAMDLSRKLGLSVGNSSVYVWLNASGAPGPDTRPKLAKLLGVLEAALTPRSKSDLRVPVPVVARPQGTPGSGGGRVADVLGFTVGADGTARIRLDVTMGVADAMPLVRMLLDAGLVLGTGTKSE